MNPNSASAANRGLAAWAVSASLLLGGGDAAAAPTADDLIVVDCLLPGQIRQLARSTTYLSARRPVKTTAFDCRVRNGEYVVEDRASLSTALKVWLASAEAGDAEAQTTVGEVFERGMGVAPDYAAAALWYRRAADAGYSRAQINLGNLYEKGLGVAQDSRAALDWYRRAAGIDGAIDLDPTPDVSAAIAERDEARKRLAAELERLQSELHTVRDELDASRAESQSTAARATQDSATYEDTMHARLLESDGLTKTIAAREAEIRVLQADLAQTRAALTEEQSGLAQARAAAASQHDAVAAVGETARAARLEAELRESELGAALERLAQRERLLAEQSRETDALKARIQSLETATAPRNSDVAQGLLAGPEITLIDPVLPHTRGLVKVTVAESLDRRNIVGRVDAPAGLLSVTVNDTPTIPNQTGVFVSELVLHKTEANVSVTAIDKQGKRSDLAFVLAPSPTSAAAVARSNQTGDSRVRDVDFGHYHALLIGNSTYRYLPRLNTPVADVDAIDQVLRERFGFETTVLRDASRYDILSALNDARAKLTTNDNLLVYYAGHGELDEINMRGHWLPVDAEPNSTANWISNVAITDILNVIKAKQILLIVDSCYSGTLTRSSISTLETKLTDSERLTWLKLMAPKRARVVLTSGALAPVLDAGGGRHSVFARALLETLESTNDITEGQTLYRELAARVAHAAAEYDFEQTPQFAPIAHAGHEAGDFFLLPRGH